MEQSLLKAHVLNSSRSLHIVLLVFHSKMECMLELYF